MEKFLIVSIEFYQKYISPDQGLPKKIGLTAGGHCVFTPTCSEYSKQAIAKYGSTRGMWLGLKRIFRCHPWQKNHFNPLI